MFGLNAQQVTHDAPLRARRLLLLASDAENFLETVSNSVCTAARNSGYQVLQAATSTLDNDAWTDIARNTIDVMIALGAPAAITGRRHLGMTFPRMARVLILDDHAHVSTDSARAARMVDVVVTSWLGRSDVVPLPLRPAVVRCPTNDREWRVVFDRAFMHRKGLMRDATH